MHSFIQSFSHKNINYSTNFSNFSEKYDQKKKKDEKSKKSFQANKYLPKKNNNNNFFFANISTEILLFLKAS